MDLLNKEKVREGLHSLPAKQQLSFGLSCCQRLAPNFRLYAIDEGTKDSGIENRIMEILWNSVADIPISKEDFDKILVELRGIPLGDDCRSVFQAIAQPAVCAFDWMIQCQYDAECDRVEKLVQIANWCLDSIQEWILLTTSVYREFLDQSTIQLAQLASLPSSQTSVREYEQMIRNAERSWVNSHPMIEAERQKQFFDLAVLAGIKDVDAPFVRLLQRSSDAQGIQPFKRGIVLGRRP